MKGAASKDLLQITDFTSDEIRATIDLALDLKRGKYNKRPLEGRSTAHIFHKPSLRTRISFETGVAALGGSPIFVTDAEIKLGQRESIADVARVLSRYVALITIRTFDHSHVEELAKWATVPVVNALTDLTHPCQIMADIMTARERLGHIDNLTVAFLGDGNNCFHSWANLAARIPMDLRLGTAPETLPDAALVKRAAAAGLSKIIVTHDSIEAVRDADIVYTDVWASMGQKDQAVERAKTLEKFQVNGTLLKHAKPTAIVEHCLPAERGREITDEVIDGPQSVVFDEAENRWWAQSAIVLMLLAGQGKIQV